MATLSASSEPIELEPIAPAPTAAPAPDSPWWRKPLILGSQLAPGVLANFLPAGMGAVAAPNAIEPPGQVERYIPGMATQAWSAPGALGSLLKPLIGTDLGLSSVPGTERAGELADMSRDAARGLIPNVRANPDVPAEVLAEQVGDAAGSFLTPIPGAALTKLPKVAQVVTHALLPGASHTRVAVGTSAGIAAGVNALMTPGQAEAAPSPIQQVIDLPPVDQDVSRTVKGSPDPGMSNLDKTRFYADKHQVSRQLAEAVLMQESGGVNGKTNPTSGAQGLFQLMPETAKAMGVTDPWDPDQNIEAGIKILKEGANKYGTVEGAARHFYGGGNQAKWGINTYGYGDAIAGRYRELQAQAQSNAPITLDKPPIELDPVPGGLTFLDILKTIGAGLVIAGGGAAATRSARGLAGMTREQLYQRASRDFNAASDLRGTGPIDAPIQAAPVAGVNMATRLQAGIQDSNAPLTKFLSAIADTPQERELMVSKAGLALNDVAVDSRIAEFMRTGVDETTGERMPSILEHRLKVDRLEPEQHAVYTNARNALDEIENRERRMRNAMASGTLGTDESYRVNFWKHDSEALREEIAKGNVDPVVKALIDERRIINARLPEIAEKHNYLTPGDASRVKLEHKDYLASTDPNGVILHPFENRNITPFSGLEGITTPAKFIDAQHDYKLMKAIYKNDFMADFITKAYKWQENKNNARLFEPHRGPPDGVHPGDWIQESRANNVIAVRIGGELEYHRVNDPLMYRALEGDISTTGTLLTGLNRAKNVMQRLTTGPLALIGGSFFGGTQFVRNIFTTAAIRPKGFSTSPLDAAMNKVTGGRMGVPGDIVGTAAANTYALAADAAAVGSHYIGQILHKTNPNTANVVLRTMLGDARVDAMSVRAQAAYARSSLAEQRAVGVRSSGGYAATEIPTTREHATATTLYNPLDSMTHSNLTNIPILRQGQQFLFNVHDLAREVHDLLSEAAVSSMYRINRGQMPGMKWAGNGKPKEVIAATSRNMLGDFGKQGSSKTAQAIKNYVPYGNIAIQDFARLIEGFKSNPGGTIFGLTTALGTAAAGSILTAMAHGPAALDMLDNELSSDQLSRGVTLFPAAGRPTEQYTVLSLSQRERMFYPVILQLMRDAFDVASTYTDADARSHAIEGLMTLLGRHITPLTEDATLAGASSMLSVPLPPPVAAFGNMLGRVVTPSLDRMVNGDQSSRAFIDRFSMPLVGSAPIMPNEQGGVDSLTQTSVGLVARNIMSSVLGVVGGFIGKALDVGNDKLAWGGSGSEAALSVMDAWKQGFLDQTPQANMLWKGDQLLGKSTPLANMVYNKVNAIRPMASAAGDLAHEGQTRNRGPAIDIAPGAGKVPTDPAMQNLWFIGGGFAKVINSQLMPLVHDIDKMIYANEHSGSSQLTIRQEHNKLIRDRQVELTKVATALRDMEDEMSKAVGKKVQVEKIDWSKTTAQFQ